ncbi:MAG: hypothetical protein JO020_33620 [Chloroflexi bacterium]|nr:hypothetical protein [Chloroflexota bacterium]
MKPGHPDVCGAVHVGASLVQPVHCIEPTRRHPSPGLGPFWLSRFLVDFLNRHCHVDLRLIERGSGVLLKLLGSGEIRAARVLLVFTVGRWAAERGPHTRALDTFLHFVVTWWSDQTKGTT